MLSLLHKKFFVGGIQKFLPREILLEVMQYQVVFPVKNRGNLTQLSIPSTGSYTPTGNLSGKASIKPFILSLEPLLVNGGKNAFKVLFPFFSHDLAQPQIFANFSSELETLKDNLVRPVVLGEDGDLVLKLVVKTTKGFGKRPFLPVLSGSWAGFASNSKIRNAKSVSLAADPNSLIGERVSSPSVKTSPTDSVIEAEVVSEGEAKPTKKPKRNGNGEQGTP
jgi:hypothetical protein